MGHDPRFKAVQAAIADMLPAAIVELQKQVTSPSTPESVRIKAIERVIELNKRKMPSVASDKQALIVFLQQNNLTRTSRNQTGQSKICAFFAQISFVRPLIGTIQTPEAYLKASQAFAAATSVVDEVIEGEFSTPKTG